MRRSSSRKTQCRACWCCSDQVMIASTQATTRKTRLCVALFRSNKTQGRPRLSRPNLMYHHAIGVTSPEGCRDARERTS